MHKLNKSLNIERNTIYNAYDKYTYTVGSAKHQQGKFTTFKARGAEVVYLT